jgi:hypothetical protein
MMVFGVAGILYRIERRNEREDLGRVSEGWRVDHQRNHDGRTGSERILQAREALPRRRP